LLSLQCIINAEFLFRWRIIGDGQLAILLIPIASLAGSSGKIEMSWVGASCFSYSQEEKLQQQLASIRHHSPEKFASTVDFCFLGPSKCGKTSLLFQFAYFLAEHGKRVTFVCESSKMQSTLPRYPDGFRPKEDVLHRIFLKYVSSCDELNEFLSSIHNKEEQQLRDVLIVDDLFFLISKEAEKERLARLCWFLALLRETAIFFRGQHELRWA